MSIAYLPGRPAHAETHNEVEIYVCRGGCYCDDNDEPCPFCVKLCQAPGATSVTSLITGCEVWGAGVLML
ncbi:MAG: hypothetical protein ACREDO_01490 [Methyloceanibacter sp.]